METQGASPGPQEHGELDRKERLERLRQAVVSRGGDAAKVLQRWLQLSQEESASRRR
jgi:flagellar biosynthesis/type III secretory pathway M-ring protein FliF/YscJ